jgi:exoribonuclease-2
MNVFYEEDGAFRVGTVLADNGASLQVEAPHGKRSKVKAAAVLLRFETPAAAFLGEAQRAADAIDVDFLWQCCGAGEFDYQALAREYYGREPTPPEAAAILIRLHGAPMYFYKKGRGRYKAAPPEALKAALASVERKRRQAELRQEYEARLARGELPPALRAKLPELLYTPDRGSIEWKALESACAALKLTPARLIERCGALPPPHDYHLNRFLHVHFPRGLGDRDACATPPPSLPQADVRAFSIDDASTTEIDDAFSVTPLPDGAARIGIHIAAPALGVPPGSPADAQARERLSTVYFPGGKITMLPGAAIDAYTLGAGGPRPALSLYADVAADGTVRAADTRLESVPIAANLRHDALEPLLGPEALARGEVEHPFGTELRLLWQWALRLERARRGDEPEVEQRPEYAFNVENGRVTITRRNRGSPLDKLVSELMIYVNSEWGRRLAQHGVAAIYRVQGAGKVRMSTVPAVHEGLGVAQYAWSSSPLRRYVDLVNQRQLVALARGEAPPLRAADAALLAVVRDFEAAYDAYAEFQRGMERYWCLRWLLQEGVSTIAATVIRDDLARLDGLPLVVRAPSLPALEPGARVEFAVSAIDELELTLHCEFRRRLPPAGTAA